MPNSSGDKLNISIPRTASPIPISPTTTPCQPIRSSCSTSTAGTPEKIFDQFKSKLHEHKSWASSLEAKQSHAIFECLAHNLLLLFEQYLGHGECLRDELEEKKQQGRTKAGAAASKAAGIVRAAGNFINTALRGWYQARPPRLARRHASGSQRDQLRFRLQ